MYRNKKIVIIAAIVIFLILLAIVLSVIFSSKKDNGKDDNLKNINAEETILPIVDNKKVITEIKDVDIATMRKVTNNEADIRNSAIFVVENMGSYSTDTYDFVNLRNAKLLSTEEQKRRIDDLILSYKKNNQDNNPYYGVTTKALSVEILTPETIEGGGPVEVIVSTQRIETVGENNPTATIKYKKMEAEIVKDNDKWLVNSTRWQ